MQDKPALNPDIQSKAHRWLTPPFDSATQEEVKNLLSQDPQQLIDAFYANLSFGTAGLRGIVGVGTNRMNRYTVAIATQGLANYILKHSKAPRVAIAYDCRHHSKEFAQAAASVLAANGIEVLLSTELRPTPFLSFVCRHRRCIAAIMITASHNPPQYNGYKVYWEDGAQIVPPHDQGIIQEIHRITDISNVKTADVSHPLIHFLDSSDDEAYLQQLSLLQLSPDTSKEGHLLQVVFSNLHGTGMTLLPRALKLWGFTELHSVKQQELPDGNFPTVHTPNPELKETLKLGIDLLLQIQGDILLATDPDADRIGVAIQHKGKAVLFNGNQIASICLYYLLNTLHAHHQLRKKSFVVSTIVTTPLLKALCEAYGVLYFDTLTGFKYIGEKIREFELKSPQYHFLFGAEESFGFLYGSHARDKDAMITACLLCEIALHQKKQGQSLLDLLYLIYEQFGVYDEKQLSISLPEGEKSQKLIEHSMKHLRDHPHFHLEERKTLFIDDYLLSVRKDLRTQQTSPLLLPKSDVLVYHYDNGSQFVIRPSGTEPKIKIYGMTHTPPSKDISSTLLACQTELDAALKKIKKYYLNL
jgi:phosphoglucomutase/phosphomannomutase